MGREHIHAVLDHAVNRNAIAQLAPQLIMGHVPRGAPKVRRAHEVERARATQRHHIDADAFQRLQPSRDAKTKRIRAAGLAGPSLRERPHLAKPVSHHPDRFARGARFTAERIAPPVEFQAFEIIVLHHLLDLRHHQRAHFLPLVVQAFAISRQPLGRRVGAPLQPHFLLPQQRHVEVTARKIAMPVHVVHADADPGGDTAAAAGLRGLGQPVHARVEQILVEVHEGDRVIQKLLDRGGLGQIHANRVATEKLAVPALVAVEDGRDDLARIPRARSVGVDHERIDAAVRQHIDVAVNCLRRVGSAFRVPFFRIVEKHAGIAVEQVAMARVDAAHPWRRGGRDAATGSCRGIVGRYRGTGQHSGEAGGDRGAHRGGTNEVSTSFHGAGAKVCFSAQSVMERPRGYAQKLSPSPRLSRIPCASLASRSGREPFGSGR